MKEISSKVNGIKERFKLRSIEYKDEWSVPQFCACLSTLLAYVDKWHERLLSLKGACLRAFSLAERQEGLATVDVCL